MNPLVSLLFQRSVLMLSVLLGFASSWIARAQETEAPARTSSSFAPDSLPQAPPPAPRYKRENFYPFTGIFCGSGASTSSAATKPTFGCGVGFTFIPLPLYTEIGVMGPQANRSYLSGYVSTDINLALAPTTSTYVPVALFGYSRLFETGHALDYGLALVLPRPGTKETQSTGNLRVELRDYWTFASPNQHNVVLRVGLVGIETD